MLTNPGIIGLDLLNAASYGAYAVNLNQVISYWNPAAERITGHRAEVVVGRRCYEVLQNCPADENEPWCRDGCPSLQAIRENRMPSAYEVTMLCASGQKKTVILTPMVVPEPLSSETLLVHLFHEHREYDPSRNPATNDAEQHATPMRLAEGMEKLTPRELEILKLTALGLTPKEIAKELRISYHTVRNHISRTMQKLGTPTRLGMVVSAQNIGLV